MTLHAPQNQEPEKTAVLKGLRNLIIIVVLVVAAGAGIYWFAIRDTVQTANVGNCLNTSAGLGSQLQEIKVVDCSDATAKTKVVGVIRDVTEKRWDETKDTNLCAQWPQSDRAIWFGPSGKETGDVLCLVKK